MEDNQNQEEQNNNQPNQQQFQGQVLRVRLPKKGEVLGIVETRLGYGKSRVICQDQKTRICRIPGGMRRHLWVRPQNIVLVRLWEIGGDEKGDIIHQYSQAEVDWLKRKGFLKNV